MKKYIIKEPDWLVLEAHQNKYFWDIIIKDTGEVIACNMTLENITHYFPQVDKFVYTKIKY